MAFFLRIFFLIKCIGDFFTGVAGIPYQITWMASSEDLFII